MGLDRQFFDVIKLLIKPVVRFCLKHGVPVQVFIEAAKNVYVDTAAEELEREHREITVSKIRVITGLHRRDVARIYREGRTLEPPLHYIAGVIGQWQHNTRFLTASRKPRVLSCETEDSEFNQLVKLVSSDVHPSTVLFEMNRIGVVEKTLNGVRLKHQMYRPSGDVVEGFRIGARDSQYLLESVEENLLLDPKIPNLHIMTQYDNIREDALDQIKAWMVEQGSRFHKKARDYLSRFDLDLNPDRTKKGGARVALGTFSNVKAEVASTAKKSPPKKRAPLS